MTFMSTLGALREFLPGASFFHRQSFLRNALALAIFSAIFTAPLSFARADLLDEFQALPKDKLEVRLDFISSQKDAFADAFCAGLNWGRGQSDAAFMKNAATSYYKALNDSLLIYDFEFASTATPEAIQTWHRGILAEREGQNLKAAKDHPGSAAAFERAALAYQEAGHLRREAVVWGTLGVAYWFSGDFVQVKAAYAKALDARKRWGDPVLIGRTLNGLGSANLRTGDLEAALDWYEQARSVREKIGNTLDLGTTLAYIGNVHTMLGNLDRSRERYIQALETFGPDAPANKLRPARVGLAIVHANLGEYEEAAKLYRSEIERAEASGDLRAAALTRRNLAIALSNLGDHTAALRELLRAAEVQTAEADSFELASTTKSIGSSYFALQNYPRALESYREASKIAYDTGNIRVELEALTNTGSTYINMGLPAKGVETLEEALAVAREVKAVNSEADILSLLGGTYETAGEYDKALSNYEQALEIDKDLGQSGILAARYLNVGNALTALGRNTEGLENLRQAASLAEAAGNREALWPCYLGIGDNFETAGVLDSARVYNARAIDLLESLRSREASEDTKAASLGRRAYVYEAQVHVLAKLYATTDKREWAAEAFTTAERGKARAFLDGLSESNIDLEDQIDPKLAAERQSLDRALNTVRYRLRQAEGSVADPDSVRAWKRRLRKLERAEGRLLEEVRIQSPAFASINTGSPHSLKELRRDLLRDKHDVLLQYSLGDSASYLWVVTQKDLAFHALPARGHIEAQVQALRAGLVSPQAKNDASYLQAAHTLYNWLLATAAGSVDKAKRIFVVPDGALQFVPMDVLLTKKMDPPAADLTPKDRGKYFGELPFALKGKELRYGPSATALAVMATRNDHARVAAKDLLAVGDPTFIQASSENADASLAPLPFTRTEVEAIAKDFDESKCTILLGEKAQEATLTQPDFLGDFRILHFATHGLVNERRPERSRLALAAPEDATADGYLEASEIYRLKLNADLVVLSACETGLGKMIQGEGVLGLPRAFLYAGARNVVVSLWSVSDQSTAALMYAFYKNLGDKEPEPGLALSRAKETLRQETKFAHPFYWAAFSLIGP